MAAYKDEKTGTYYVKFYYTDWTGKKSRNLSGALLVRKTPRAGNDYFWKSWPRAPILLLKHCTANI